MPTGTILRWSRIEPFKPGSWQQVQRYIKAKGWPIPRDRRGNLTTNEEGLEGLIDKTGDPGLQKIIRCRKIGKARGYLYDTFLGRDGRMHSQFSNAPKTGRLSSRAPNLQNQPQGRYSDVEGLLAKAIRSTIIPSPGCLLVELDWKNIEALLVGYFAEDHDYIRMCKINAHAFLASHLLADKGIIPEPARYEWSDGRLKEFLTRIKSAHPSVYALGKKANLSGNYGQGPKSKARDLGCTIKEAIHLVEIMDSSAPKVAKWKIATRLQAHEQGKLINPFGYIQYFWNVFERKRNGDLGYGGEAWEALAFLPQSSAAAMMRETILKLVQLPGYGQFFWLLVPVHDSLLLEVREDKLAEVREMVRELMEQPWLELEGLRVETEAKVGTNWGEMAA